MDRDGTRRRSGKGALVVGLAASVAVHLAAFAAVEVIWDGSDAATAGEENRSLTLLSADAETEPEPDLELIRLAVRKDVPPAAESVPSRAFGAPPTADRVAPVEPAPATVPAQTLAAAPPAPAPPVPDSESGRAEAEPTDAEATPGGTVESSLLDDRWTLGLAGTESAAPEHTRIRMPMQPKRTFGDTYSGSDDRDRRGRDGPGLGEAILQGIGIILTGGGYCPPVHGGLGIY